MSQSLAEVVAHLPDAERADILADLDPATLQYDARFWLRPEQLPPLSFSFDTPRPEEHKPVPIWAVIAGRGFGKSRTGAEWVRDAARRNPGCRIALVARTSADVRDVMVQGESGIIAVSPPSECPTYEPSKRRLAWPNGCQATLFSSEEPSQLRGPQFHFSWGDEVASWDFRPDDSGLNSWDNLVIATRLGDRPRVLATTTPKRTPFMRSLQDFQARGIAVLTRGSTFDNASNLSPAYLDVLTGLYGGTRLGAQELEGIVLDDVEGALWVEALLDAHRIPSPLFAPSLSEAPLRFVGVDPSVAERPRDECGIVAVAATASPSKLLHRRHAYVLEDASLLASPSVWATAAIACARRNHAVIVAEDNQGGELVRATLHGVDPTIPVFLVHSKQGKALRAEPVVSSYEQGRVHHVGYHPLLEAQQTSWVPDETRRSSSSSPDRIDALVHALTAALIRPPKGYYAPGLGRVRARSATSSLLSSSSAPPFGSSHSSHSSHSSPLTPAHVLAAAAASPFAAPARLSRVRAALTSRR